jgi:hypothetical protein
MKTEFSCNPRIFMVGGIEVHDTGKIYLEPNEMVSFVTPGGKECDFTATKWGFYLAPSLNSRLKREGFKTALVMNGDNKLFVNAVEVDKIELFNSYLETNNSRVLCWLDEWLASEE